MAAIMTGKELLQRSREIVAEYLQQFSLPDEIEFGDCVSEVALALLILHDEGRERITDGLEWLRGRDAITMLIRRDRRQRNP